MSWWSLNATVPNWKKNKSNPLAHLHLNCCSTVPAREHLRHKTECERVGPGNRNVSEKFRRQPYDQNTKTRTQCTETLQFYQNIIFTFNNRQGFSKINFTPIQLAPQDFHVLNLFAFLCNTGTMLRDTTFLLPVFKTNSKTTKVYF